MARDREEHGGHDSREALKSVDDIKKLSPAERIKRLKELEEARKKEIEEAEQLIRETALEMAEAEEKRHIPIPEARATDLSTLDTAEEKQIVSTHHFLATAEAGADAQQQPGKQKPKSLEEMAGDETVKQQQQTQQNQAVGKPAYSIGTEQQKSAFGEYLSKSQQTVTGSSPIPGSGLEKITEIYKNMAVTGTESADAQQKYFGTHQQVTGGYEMRKKEEEEKHSQTQSETYRRRGGPA